VNDRMTTEGAGKAMKTVWKPRSAEEMHRLEELAQAAVGFDQKRGDQVVIENMSFSGNSPEPPEPILDKVTEGAKGFLHSQPNLLRTLMIGACGVLLVMFVLKPVGKQMAETLKEPVMLAPPAQHAGALGPGAPQGAPGAMAVKQLSMAQENPGGMTVGSAEGGAQDASLPRRRGKTSAQVIFDTITQNIQNDPTQSTRLLQGWIGGPEQQQQPQG